MREGLEVFWEAAMYAPCSVPKIKISDVLRSWRFLSKTVAVSFYMKSIHSFYNRSIHSQEE